MWQYAKLSTARAAFVTAGTAASEMGSLKASAALAKVIADRLPLPSGPAEDISNYYAMTLSLDVAAKISELGEICMIDSVKVRDLVKAFYSARYQIVYPKKYVFIRSKESTMTDIFGMSAFLSSNVVKEIIEQGNRFMYFYNEFSCLMDELGNSRSDAVQE